MTKVRKYLLLLFREGNRKEGSKVGTVKSDHEGRGEELEPSFQYLSIPYHVASRYSCSTQLRAGTRTVMPRYQTMPYCSHKIATLNFCIHSKCIVDNIFLLAFFFYRAI